MNKIRILPNRYGTQQCHRTISWNIKGKSKTKGNNIRIRRKAKLCWKANKQKSLSESSVIMEKRGGKEQFSVGSLVYRLLAIRLDWIFEWYISLCIGCLTAVQCKIKGGMGHWWSFCYWLFLSSVCWRNSKRNSYPSPRGDSLQILSTG